MQNQQQYPAHEPLSALPQEGKARIANLAQRHGFSERAVSTLASAMARGHGHQAQFSDVELGGMGQWSRGGMLMIGDMFNAALKARVAALCEDVALLVESHGENDPSSPLFEASRSELGSISWPAELGVPSSTGTQNDVHYGVFPAASRFAISEGGRVTVYDTGDHRITGLGQQQGSGRSLSLTSQRGTVSLKDLPIVRGNEGEEIEGDLAASLTREQTAAVTGPIPHTASADDAEAIFSKIEGLAGLHAKGHVTDEEFREKKAELLSRL